MPSIISPAVTWAELAFNDSKTDGIEIENSASFWASTATLNSFFSPPRNVISDTPSIRDNFSIISNSTKSPKLPKLSILEFGNLTIARRDIGLSSEFEVLTIGRFASAGKPSIDATLLKSWIRAISISWPTA